MSSGAKRTTAYIREKTAGVTPSGAFTELKRTSFGLAPTYNRNESDEIGKNRMAQAQSAGLIDVGGDIGTLFRNENLDDFLASVFGNEWDDGKLELGDERISFSVASNDRDIGVQSITRGAQVDTLAFSMPNDGDITCTLSMLGMSHDTRIGTPFYTGELIDAPDNPKYDFISIKNVLIDGESLANEDGTRKACIDTFSLQFANNSQVQRCIGNGTGWPGANIPMQFTPTGSITLAWSPFAYELWATMKTKKAVSLQFDVYHEEGGYRFYIPKMDFSGSWPDGGRDEIIQATLDYAAHTDSPVITKLDGNGEPVTTNPIEDEEAA